MCKMFQSVTLSFYMLILQTLDQACTQCSFPVLNSRMIYLYSICVIIAGQLSNDFTQQPIDLNP